MTAMNYYDILEVSHNASPEVIQNAYKTLAKKYHPDVYQGDKSFAEEQMKQINEAYEVLSDPQKRMEYDRRIKNNPNSNSDNKETEKNTNIALSENLINITADTTQVANLQAMNGASGNIVDSQGKTLAKVEYGIITEIY